LHRVLPLPQLRKHSHTAADNAEIRINDHLLKRIDIHLAHTPSSGKIRHTIFEFDFLKDLLRYREYITQPVNYKDFSGIFP